MVLHDPLHHMLVSSIAERRICRHLAVAELVIARLGNVEYNRPVARDNPLALAVAEGIELRMTAAAPVIGFAFCQENMRRVDTGESGHAWRPVTPFLIRTRFAQCDDLLFREVRHIIHGNTLARCRRPQNLRLRGEDVTLVCLHLAAGWTDNVSHNNLHLLDVDVALDLVPVWLLRFIVLVGLEEVDLLVHFIICH